jgi:hypothetical protein
LSFLDSHDPARRLQGTGQMMTQALVPLKTDRTAHGAYRRLGLDGAAPMIEIEPPLRDERFRFARDHRPAFSAEPSVMFVAQQIAQEQMGEGAHIEDYRPAVAAYAAGKMFAPTINVLA